MALGISLNPSGDENAVDATVDRATLAAEAGFGSVWFGQRLDYDAISLATVVGREVPGIEVGTSAVPIFGRHPLLIASQAQTAQAATGGRFRLGLALGAKALVEPTFGVDYRRPVELLSEFLVATRALVTTGTADHHGERLTVAPPLPTTVGGAGTGLQFLVAAMGPRALQVSGELADGILPFLAGPRTLAETIVPTVRRAAAEAGRPEPRIVAFVAAVVTDDVPAGRAAAAETMAFYDAIPSYQRVIAQEGHARAADLVLIGRSGEVRAGIERYFDAGATEVVVTQTDLLGRSVQKTTIDALGDLPTP
ncbi:MAG: TIGR03564 family F420-dependent LLM class oxidoreductase [Gordonia paraffinivorans]